MPNTIPESVAQPTVEFLEPHADVGARHAELLDDVVGVQGGSGHEQQGVDLPHRAIDSPPAAHLAEVEYEGLDERR